MYLKTGVAGCALISIVSKNMPGVNSLGTVPDVRIIQYWSQEEVKQDNHSEYIARYVEGRCEWLSCIIDLCPIQADGE